MLLCIWIYINTCALISLDGDSTRLLVVEFYTLFLECLLVHMNIQEWAGHSRFIRVMPNTPAAVGLAASGIVNHI